MNTFFKNIAVLLMLMVSINITAQKSSDLSNIVLNPYVSDDITSLTPAAKNYLENKLSQIVLNNGVSGDGLNGRYVLTANITEISKDYTSTAPPMTALSLDLLPSPQH